MGNAIKKAIKTNNYEWIDNYLNNSKIKEKTDLNIKFKNGDTYNFFIYSIKKLKFLLFMCTYYFSLLWILFRTLLIILLPLLISSQICVKHLRQAILNM